MAEIVVTVLAKIAEYTVAPIGRQLCYVFCLNDNVETLKDVMEKLENVKARVQMQVDAALRNVEIVYPDVETWLLDVSRTVDEAQTIFQEKANLPKGCFNQWCLNLKRSYVLSRKAKKKTKDITRLFQDGKFDKISLPAPLLPVVGSTSIIRSFGTRKWILDDIVRNLKDDNISMIGICGMGGVGKTTMAVEVRKRVKEEKLFDDCAMVVIGQKQNLTKVQSHVAEMLGLELHEQNPIVREAKLHLRLENSRVLVILDDVWEEFDLKVLGITIQKGCKVLFTSREQGLWKELKTKIDFPLAILTEEEAWDLFEAKVGDSLEEKPQLRRVAKEITKECGGLPLALVTIGAALLGKNTHLWNDTLRQLRTNYPIKVQGVSAKVYQSLELSYNFLEEDAKSLFLLCCLFEEDFSIPIEDLVMMTLGLRLFVGINDLEQTRDRVLALLELLKSRSLLLPSWCIPYFVDGNKTHDVARDVAKSNVAVETGALDGVKMHDVVRDVAKLIASVEMGALVVDNGAELKVWQEQGMLQDSKWISIMSNEIREIPSKLRSPRVQLLRCSDTVLQIIASFDGMGELRVLDVYGKESSQLSSLMEFPSSLRTLHFRECELNNITDIGDLPNLETLSFRGSRIEELPIEMGRLIKLVSLDLTWCFDLRTIRPGVISGLCQLQELYMEHLDIDWEGGENEEGRNANLREFESLSHLHTLHIKIKDPSVLPRSPVFRNLRKYDIQIGARKIFGSYEKSCSISLRTFVPLEGDIKFLSENAELLCLDGDFTKDLVHGLVQDGSQSLKHLKVYNIDTLEYVANAVAPLLFFTVESLSLLHMENLQQISHDPLMVGSFTKLKKLDVGNCRSLKNIFPLSIVTELLHLESLSVRLCGSMEQVIWKEREEDGAKKIALLALEELKLSHLPSLIGFCRGIDEIEFPRLKFLTVWNLPQLECLFIGCRNQSIFAYKASFPNLENIVLADLVNMKEIWCGQLQSRSFRNVAQLTIRRCHKLRSVFTTFMARYLVHLHSLDISYCSLLEVVVAKEEEVDGMVDTNLLPELKKLELKKMPALESFCHVAHDLEFPMLEEVRVVECPELKAFSPACVRHPKLNNVKVSYWNAVKKEETLWVDNLNSTILHLHNQKRS